MRGQRFKSRWEWIEPAGVAPSDVAAAAATKLIINPNSDTSVGWLWLHCGASTSFCFSKSHLALGDLPADLPRL